VTFSIPKPHKTIHVQCSDGATLVCRQHGNQKGVRLFISHGNGFAVDGYYPFWQHLEHDYELIVFDFRNHGQSAIAENHSYAQFARDIECVFHKINDALGQKPNVGIFHSMSARAAMKHVVEIDWVWDGLMLFDPPNVPPSDHSLYPAMIKFEKRLETWASERKHIFNSPQELVTVYSDSRATSRWARGTHELMARSVLRETSGKFELVCRPKLEVSIYAAASTLNLWPPASAFAGPMKLIGADPQMKGAPPTAHANKALHDEMGYDYTCVPNTGHMLQIESPEACANEVLKFINQHDLHI